MWSVTRPFEKTLLHGNKVITKQMPDLKMVKQSRKTPSVQKQHFNIHMRLIV